MKSQRVKLTPGCSVIYCRHTRLRASAMFKAWRFNWELLELVDPLSSPVVPSHPEASPPGQDCRGGECAPIRAALFIIYKILFHSSLHLDLFIHKFFKTATLQSQVMFWFQNQSSTLKYPPAPSARSHQMMMTLAEVCKVRLWSEHSTH